MNNSQSIHSTISTIRSRANQVILEQLRRHGIDDVVPAHGAIFVALFKNTEMPVGQIAQAISRDKSTVTILVNKLVGLDYLEKRRDDTDSRISLIRLSPKGRALEPVFRDISTHLLDKTYAGFTDLEKDILMTLLGRIKDNL